MKKDSFLDEVAQRIGANLIGFFVPLPLVECIPLESHCQGKVDREYVGLLDANTRYIMQSERVGNSQVI
jgi:hypothetical protein